jgi:hypothetical protein
MAKNSQHVFLNENGLWIVKKDGASKASRSFSDKKEAITWAESVARNQSSELYVHSKEGRITEKHTYGSNSYSVSWESRSGKSAYVKRDKDGRIVPNKKTDNKR